MIRGGVLGSDLVWFRLYWFVWVLGFYFVTGLRVFYRCYRKITIIKIIINSGGGRGSGLESVFDFWVYFLLVRGGCFR